jgi:hybrid cluster-associated redox disulfide protein
LIVVDEIVMMEQKSPITREQIAETLISELLERWPATAVVFQKHNMACVGCVVAPFYAIEVAISIYNLDREAFLNELALVIEESANGREELC